MPFVGYINYQFGLKCSSWVQRKNDSTYLLLQNVKMMEEEQFASVQHQGIPNYELNRGL